MGIGKQKAVSIILATSLPSLQITLSGLLLCFSALNFVFPDYGQALFYLTDFALNSPLCLECSFPNFSSSWQLHILQYFSRVMSSHKSLLALFSCDIVIPVSIILLCSKLSTSFIALFLICNSQFGYLQFIYLPQKVSFMRPGPCLSCSQLYSWHLGQCLVNSK